MKKWPLSEDIGTSIYGKTFFDFIVTMPSIGPQCREPRRGTSQEANRPRYKKFRISLYNTFFHPFPETLYYITRINGSIDRQTGEGAGEADRQIDIEIDRQIKRVISTKGDD